MTLDPLDYLIQKDLYPLLFPVAPGILCTASTVPVEHVFSASEVTRGKRYRLPNDNLERETLGHKKPICFTVQSNTAMHTLMMLKYTNYQRYFISPGQT